MGCIGDVVQHRISVGAGTPDNNVVPGKLEKARHYYCAFSQVAPSSVHVLQTSARCVSESKQGRSMVLELFARWNTTSRACLFAAGWRCQLHPLIWVAGSVLVSISGEGHEMSLGAWLIDTLMIDAR